jgi:hypothetical protein
VGASPNEAGAQGAGANTFDVSLNGKAQRIRFAGRTQSHERTGGHARAAVGITSRVDAALADFASVKRHMKCAHRADPVYDDSPSPISDANDLRQRMAAHPHRCWKAQHHEARRHEDRTGQPRGRCRVLLTGGLGWDAAEVPAAGAKAFDGQSRCAGIVAGSPAITSSSCPMAVSAVFRLLAAWLAEAHRDDGGHEFAVICTV